ncbi:MobF family relaxase [Sinorhizobium meliloti]|uniref:MobF family relaxase n=1 Tax=Rhizobium meliloti TaxID=382 RepID=UPI003D659795
MWDQRPVPVTSLQYYRDQNADSRRELGYYGGTDNETHRAESFGRYFVPALCSSSIHQSVVHGARVDFEVAEKLSQATNPDNGEDYFTRNSLNAYIAFDATNSAPKRFSMAKAFGMAEYHRTGNPLALAVANAVTEAHREANDYSLNWLCEKGGFETRSGTGSKIREIPDSMAFMQFEHFTSRKGDMQVHTHNVLINLCRRKDGSYGALDNHGYTLWRGAASALYRAKLASIFSAKMKELGLDVSISRDGRNITIDGIGEDITDTFCKRRKEVLEWMKERGIEGTAKHRQMAQVAAYETRDDKDDLPSIETLYQLWEVEGRAHGIDFTSLIEGIDMTAKVNARELERDWKRQLDEAERLGYDIPEERPRYDFEEVKSAALKKVLESESAFEERNYMTAFLEEVQTTMDAEEALELYDRAKEESSLIQIGAVGRSKTPVYSSLDILKEEHESFELTLSMQGNREADLLVAIAARIAEGIPKNDGSGEAWEFTEEQKDLIYSIFGVNQLTIGKGLAGTGKTTAMKAVNDIAERLGYKVWIAAPTNRAVDVLRQEIGIAPERAFSVPGINYADAQGKIELGPKDILIVDEAGMVESREFLKLQQLAKKSNTRTLAFIGDDGQLPPVGAGAPFKANLALIGGVRLEKINRQNYDWMREASLNFANMKIEDAITAYDERGCIDIVSDFDIATEKAVRRYFELRGKYGVAPVIGNPRNKVVRKINNMIVEAMRANGEIKGEITEINAVERGYNGEVKPLGIMEGMRIITGENVKFQGEKYANNSFGTILKIEESFNKAEPFITVKWDDGRTIRFQPHEFIGFRKDDEDKVTPKLAVAYCMTYYATQGMTCHSFINLATHSMSAEETYVAGTRHKEHFETILDGSRIGSSLGVKKGVVLALSNTGATSQADAEPEVVSTREEIMKQFIAECSKIGGKKNACDFLGGPKKFLEKVEQGLLANEGKDIMKFQERVAEQAKKEAEGKAAKTPYAKRSGRNGGSATSAHADKLDAKMNDIVKTDNRAAVMSDKAAVKAVVKKEPPLDDNEKNVIMTSNMLDFLADHRFVVNRKGEKANDPKGGKSMQYTASGEGAKFMIYAKANGGWGYWTIGEPDNKGDIRNFVDKNITKGSFHDACVYLRRHYDTEKLRAQYNGKPAPRPQAEPRVEETAKQVYERLEGTTYLAEKFDQIRKLWEGAKKVGSGYLLHRRGITLETQAYFRNGFRCEDNETRQNKGGVMFQMTDIAGNLYGMIRRGPTTMLDKHGDVVPYNKMAYGSERRAVIMGDWKTAERIYVEEAPINAMSLAQKDGIPEGGPKSAIIALGGSAAEGPLSVIYAISKARGETVEWHHVRQNDLPNSVGQVMDEVHGVKIREAITEGCPTAKIEDRRPDPQFKDFNDDIRGISRPIPKSVAETTVAIEARQQAKARMEGYDTPQPPVRKGPDFGI